MEDKPKNVPTERAVAIISEEDKGNREERESTIRNKELFLKILEQSRGIITVVCQKTGISRPLYYYWRKSDDIFRSKVDEILNTKPEILEDMMYAKACAGEFPALQFLLTHLHPLFQKKKENKKESTVHIHHHVAEEREDPNVGWEEIAADPKLFKIYLDWTKEKNGKFWEEYYKKYPKNS